MGNENSSFSIYPNPAVNSTIGLKLNNLPKGKYQLNLVNMAGQVICTKTIQHPGGNDRQKIATGLSLNTGIYQLEILDSAGAKTVLQVQVD